MQTEKKSILLVEDDPSLGFVIKDNLKESGFEITWAKDGVAGFEQFYSNYFDLCILDVMLPKKDGYSLAKEIRVINPDIPIIFLTAKGSIDDKAEGYKAGGDDYLSKPFVMAELVARIDAVIKRATRFQKKRTDVVKEVYTPGSITFDYNNLELTIGNVTKTLTSKEADLLRLLCLNLNQTLEREIALKLIWGENDYFLGRSMDVFVSRLRKYLQADKSLRIDTIPKIGFSLRND
ncbi:MAG: DNA-binding response regulator [Crocinitomicaceae bacterium]|nr:DNA-binding response regulator [Crocinitomicaceae bacterium]|tara:strand:+ start:1670 stop:2374 length:705 start_codon:yes stop_codon:yes gene_type:complete